MNNWKFAENFLRSSNNSNLEQLITHTTDLEKSPILLNKIYLAKNKKINLGYIKGIIK